MKLQDGVLYTFPLAGTRPRGKTDEEDQQLEKDLLADPKELAEHNMLVDLGRNDIGKISRFGTVEVEKYLSIERFSHVMHIGSTVKGLIREDKDALSAVQMPSYRQGHYPEHQKFGPVRSLMNWKTTSAEFMEGQSDTLILQETWIPVSRSELHTRKTERCLSVPVRGIVADSVPETEYQECLNKAQAVINALSKSGEAFSK